MLQDPEASLKTDLNDTPKSQAVPWSSTLRENHYRFLPVWPDLCGGAHCRSGEAGLMDFCAAELCANDDEVSSTSLCNYIKEDDYFPFPYYINQITDIITSV